MKCPTCGKEVDSTVSQSHDGPTVCELCSPGCTDVALAAAAAERDALCLMAVTPTAEAPAEVTLAAARFARAVLKQDKSPPVI